MKKDGFTLVEVSIVLIIIMGLAVILLPALQKALKRAHYASWCGLKQSNKNDPNCVGYWTFEETYTEGSDTKVANLASAYTGNLIGHTAEDCDGTLKNNPEWIPAGDGRGRFLAKPSLSFDGTNDYVDCGYDSSLNITANITVEAWVKPSSGAGEGYIVQKDNGGANRLWILKVQADLTPRFYIWDSGAILHWTPGNSALETEKWYHLVGTYDGTIQKIYVNGVLQTDTDSWSGSIKSVLTQPVEIGGRSIRFEGLIDEVAIFDVALSASEIKKRYRAGRP